LAGCVVTIGVVWLVVLPWIGSRPGMKRQIEHLDALGVDAGAMFYTELPLMNDVLADVDRRRAANPDAFWRPSSGASSDAR
jgi:hypothetical protein